MNGPGGILYADITYGNNLFVVVGGATGTLHFPPFRFIMTSPDGVTWTIISSYTEALDPLYGVTYGNNIFVAVGYGGAIVISPDGATWTPQTSGTVSPLNAVAFGNGTYVAVGKDGTILISSNGIEWRQV